MLERAIIFTELILSIAYV